MYHPPQYHIYIYLFIYILLDSQLVEQPAGTGILLDDEEHVAYIHGYGTLQLGLEGYVARHCLPVAVEGEAYELTLGIHYG